ncbi:MAG: heme biosynthesis HemY N-terminal domain-containing protein, partial [Pseudomonadota bacterium]
MIWSLIKILVFVAVATLLTYGASLLMNTEGEVRIAVGGREISLAPLGFLIAILAFLLLSWILMKIVGFVIALLRFIAGDEGAIRTYFDRGREKRGVEALSQAMLALAAGEGRKAQAKAQLAER